MDNFFFRKCMPYVVYHHDGFFIVKNRDYEPIFRCEKPTDLNLEKFFSSFVLSGDKDYVGEDAVSLFSDRAYLYNDRTCPIGNEKGYDKNYMNDYLVRLGKMVKSMRGMPLIE